MAPTDDLGQFNLTSQTDTPVEFAPRKNGDVGDAVGSLDAVYVLQSIVGQRAFSSNQRRACDVSGNGQLSALDAALILQYRVGAITQFPVAERCGSEWCFVPQPLSVPNQSLMLPDATQCQAGAIRIDPLLDEAGAQDFSAILFGDCTGNWVPDGGATAAAHSAGASPVVRIGAARKTRSGWRVPISVEGGAFHAMDLDFRYDSRTVSTARVLAMDPVRRAMLQSNTPVSGRLRVALASASPIEADGQVVLVVELGGQRAQTALLAAAVIDDQPAPVMRAASPLAKIR
jgi:hypothetical protein